MEIKTSSWTAVMLVVIQLTHISAETVLEYFRQDGTLSFSPSTVPGTVKSIMWRHKENLVAEWVKDAIDLQYYGDFVDRTELNIATGQLKIALATEADNGVFSVEINNLAQADRYKAVMIVDVPDPYVWVKPGPTYDQYVLYCDPKQGQETILPAAGPVSYQWKIGTADWVALESKVDLIVNDTTRQAETFMCKMVNPVSDKTSEPTDNPFHRSDPTPAQFAGVGVGVVLAGLLAWLGYAYKKKKCPFNRTGDAPVSPKIDETKNKLNSKEEAEEEAL